HLASRAASTSSTPASTEETSSHAEGTSASPSLTPEEIAALTENLEQMRAAVLRRVGALGLLDSRWITEVFGALRDSNSYVRMVATLALAMLVRLDALSDVDSQVSLLNMLADEAPLVRGATLLVISLLAIESPSKR